MAASTGRVHHHIASHFSPPFLDTGYQDSLPSEADSGSEVDTLSELEEDAAEECN